MSLLPQLCRKVDFNAKYMYVITCGMSNVVSCIFLKLIPMSVDSEISNLYRDDEIHMVVQNTTFRPVSKIAKSGC